MDDTSGDDPTLSDDAGPDGGEDIEALRAERDRLQAELEVVSHRRSVGTTLRRIAAPLLVIVFAMSLLASGVGVWLHRNTLNNDVWAERVVPLGKDPEVQEALATWTTAELMKVVDPKALFQEALPERGQVLAVPLANAVQSFVGERVDAFFASPRFEELWASAAVRAHDEAVAVLRDETSAITADGDKVTINLIPLINEVLNRILQAAPDLVGADVTVPKVSITDVPDAARERLSQALGRDIPADFGVITIYDGGTLAAAQDAVKTFDRLVILSIVLALLSGAAALWVSPRRRRTLLQLLGAAALVAVLIRRVAFTLQEEVLDLVKADNKGAASAVVDTFLDPMTGFLASFLWVVGAAILVALLTGPYPWAVRLRAAAAQAVGTVSTTVSDRAHDPGTVTWASDHVDALRVAGFGAAAALLWFGRVTWASLIVVGAALVAWQVALGRLVTSDPEAPEPAVAADASGPEPTTPEGDEPGPD